MAKALGIIGNIKGKVGNVVGYNLTDSNNKQTQGLRVYQPNVKNPKTAAQAEQRAKLAPINATYRALKMIIDRGNEGLPYGNKSRLAWLKNAFMSSQMPWYVKGGTVLCPVGCQLTKGSLAGVLFNVYGDMLEIEAVAATENSSVATVGAISTILLDSYSTLKAGDQVTMVFANQNGNVLNSNILSFIIDTTSTEAVTRFSAAEGKIEYDPKGGCSGAAVIISREGENGEHLRSNSRLIIVSDITATVPYDAASKKAAVESYMASASANSDWAEESIQ